MLDMKIKKARNIYSDDYFEIGILDGKIKIIAEKITQEAVQTITLQKHQYLSAGWIDAHVHCFEEMDLYYDYPDKIGYTKGCTTVIDAGTTGADNIEQFYNITKNSKTNIYALLNISKVGIVTQDELADLTNINHDSIAKTIAKFPDFIVGIKARMSKTVIGESGITPLKLAKEIQNKNNHIPLMIHIGSAPPQLEDILEQLDAGDILTHCFHGKVNGILDIDTDLLKNCAKDAYHRGVIFDIGHGTDSFNFHVAEKALENKIMATSISTDIYIRNRINGPVFDMATTLEKLHVIGYSWKDIIDKITSVPAEYYHLNTKGQIKVGYDADITIFELKKEEKILTDSNGNKKITNEQIIPKQVMIGGVLFDCQL